MRTRSLLNALLMSAAVLASSASGASAANLLSNGSFESANIGTGNYTYPGLSYGTITPIAANQGGWTFSGAALVNGSGSNAWYGGSAPAGMNGAQFAALQGTSAISQSFTASADTLHLSWLDAGRTWGMGDQSYQVLLDGQQVGGLFGTSSDDAFSLNTLDFSGLTQGASYNLTFQGLSGGDETSFLDLVALSDIAPPPIPVAPSISVSMGGLGLNEIMIEDFDSPLAAGFDFLQNNGAYVRSGALGLDSGNSAPPPGDLSNYETVLAGGHATLTSIKLLQSFSFYLGSPDSYNSVKFSGADGFEWVLNGEQIWGNAAPGNGDQSWGRRVNYNFGDFAVNKVEFFSSGNSFEFDDLAGVFKSDSINDLHGAVPEPATWAMMILGFGAIGAMIRRRNAFSLAS